MNVECPHPIVKAPNVFSTQVGFNAKAQAPLPPQPWYVIEAPSTRTSMVNSVMMLSQLTHTLM